MIDKDITYKEYTRAKDIIIQWDKKVSEIRRFRMRSVSNSDTDISSIWGKRNHLSKCIDDIKKGSKHKDFLVEYSKNLKSELLELRFKQYNNN